MSGFDQFKLPARLIEHLSALGYRRPTALQREAIPVIARGTTAIGAASAGSGKTLAYALGLAGRIDRDDPALQALILRPTDDGAAATAETLHRLLSPLGATVTLVRPERATAAHFAAASPSSALSALEHSSIKVDALKTLVVDGVSTMFELGAGDALETLAGQISREAQRVILSAASTKQVEDWADRHARRARRLSFIPPDVEPLVEVTVEYFAGPRYEWLPVLTRTLAGAGVRGDAEGTRIDCRLRAEAEELAHRLAVRGFDIAADQRSGITVAFLDEDRSDPTPLAISWGVPADLETLQERATRAKRALVFAEPDELAHLRQLVAALQVRLAPLKAGKPGEASRSAQATRDQLREAARDRDLEPYMLLLEPLLEEFTPSELAAAATALLRERAPTTPAQTLPAWTRLYFGVGRRDGVRPADLVGAITGESPLTGDRVGRIEIRDTHSSVEVAADGADQVIKSLATTTIRGRPANVRVFRE